MIDGYIVTRIEDFAFYYCTGFDGKLVIPDTVTKIGKAAFAGCYNLKSIQFSSNLSIIGEGAFIGCKGLVEITLPDPLSQIGENAFMCCRNLSITLSPKLQKIAKYAFLDVRNPINFTGTIAEWHSIEKDRYWVAYLFKSYTINKIVCTDGNINLAPLPQK